MHLSKNTLSDRDEADHVLNPVALTPPVAKANPERQHYNSNEATPRILARPMQQAAADCGKLNKSADKRFHSCRLHYGCTVLRLCGVSPSCQNLSSQLSLPQW